MLFADFLKKAKQHRLLLFILAAALLLRLAAWHVYALPVRDSCKYAGLIRTWEQLPHYPVWQYAQRPNDLPPLAVWLFKTAHQLFPSFDIIRCGTAVNLVCGLLLIFVLWIGAKRIFRSEFAANTAAALAATSPFLVTSSIRMTRESSYLLFSACAVVFAVVFVQTQKYRYAACCAVFSAWAFLCRLEGIELFSLFLLLCMILPFTEKWSFRKTVPAIALFYLAAAAALVISCRLIGCRMVFFAHAFQKILFYIQRSL